MTFQCLALCVSVRISGLSVCVCASVCPLSLSLSLSLSPSSITQKHSHTHPHTHTQTHTQTHTHAREMGSWSWDGCDNSVFSSVRMWVCLCVFLGCLCVWTYKYHWTYLFFSGVKDQRTTCVLMMSSLTMHMNEIMRKAHTSNEIIYL